MHPCLHLSWLFAEAVSKATRRADLAVVAVLSGACSCIPALSLAHLLYRNLLNARLMCQSINTAIQPFSTYDFVQVTHMPHLEEAILNTVQQGNSVGNSSSNGNGQGEGSSGSNGASRPSSPSRHSSSADHNQSAQMEIEHSYEGGPSKAPPASGLGQAAQLFGNEAHQSSDIL